MSRKPKQASKAKSNGTKVKMTWGDLIELGRKSKKSKASNTSKKEVILDVRRGKRLYGLGRCTACLCHANVLTKYSKSNIGVVTLCHQCRISAFERSFGYSDAMTLAMN